MKSDLQNSAQVYPENNSKFELVPPSSKMEVDNDLTKEDNEVKIPMTIIIIL